MNVADRSILVIGGSGFVGRHLIPALQSAGCAVTVLNRGHRLVPGTRQIHVDRNDRQRMRENATSIGQFDAIIDTSSYTEPQAAIAVEYFGGKTRHWLQLSSAAVYSGAGSTRIQFLHAADLADAFVTCLDQVRGGHSIYNVANSETVSLADWVQEAGDSSGHDIQIVIGGDNFGNYQPREYFPFRNYPCWVNPSRISEEIGWVPKIPLSDGLTLTFNTYRHEDLVRRSHPTPSEVAILATLEEHTFRPGR